MGIQDRPYYRPDASTPPAYARASGWSATTWIIAICVAVFVIDGFLPWTNEPVASQLMPGASAGQIRLIDRSEFALTKPVDVAPGVARGYAVLGRDNVVAEVDYRKERPLTRLGYFSTARAVYASDPVLGVSGFQVWRFVTFQFLHANLNHVLFNMMTLFFFGGMVENYLGKKRYVAFYLLCGVAGALMYLILNGLAIGGQAAFGPSFHLPGLLFNDPNTMLVGASAGVFGVIMAAAYLAPNATVLLFFVIPMRLGVLAYGLLVFALLAVIFGWTNAGGEAAHIGGALAGFWLVRNPNHLHGFFDFLGQYDPTSKVARARVAVKRGSVQGSASSTEVNRILDKISARGLQSLSESEKRVLRDASRKPR
ncbi:MAG: rhomboid family intramembrane serine protease [Planctomycetota bacterium]|nr:rhomboid family intramembrane serine protease [Planctomycetota bacterium]